MAVSQAEIDELVVRISADAQQYMSTLRETETRTKSWATAIGTFVGIQASRAFDRLRSSVVGFMKDSIRLASEAAETMSAFEAIFGTAAATASMEAEDLAKRIARSSREIKAGLVSQQAFFTALGFGADEAKSLSFRIQQMAIDLASFRNVADADMINRFRSALSGSTEVLDQFGINIKESALKEEAMAQGIAKSVEKMTEQEKVMLRVSLISKQMGVALGDAERTAASFANQQKGLNATWADAKTELGESLLPALNALIPIAAGVADVIGMVADEVNRLNGAMKEIRPSDPRIGVMFKNAMKDAELAVKEMGKTRQEALELQILALMELATMALPDTQKQIIGQTIRLLKEEVEKEIKAIEEALEKLRKERLAKFGFPITREIKDFVSQIGRAFHMDPVLGKHGLLGSLFFGAGKGLNEFNKIAEEMKKTTTIRQTGGQAVRAGTSEALSLTTIRQRAVTENERRDKLLTEIKGGIGKLVENGRSVLSTLKQSGITVEGVDIP